MIDVLSRSFIFRATGEDYLSQHPTQMILMHFLIQLWMGKFYTNLINQQQRRQYLVKVGSTSSIFYWNCSFHKVNFLMVNSWLFLIHYCMRYLFLYILLSHTNLFKHVKCMQCLTYVLEHLKCNKSSKKAIIFTLLYKKDAIPSTR